MLFNALRYVEIAEDKTTIFNYITDLKVEDYNIEQIVKLGRKHWKIENERFNEQKNGLIKLVTYVADLKMP